MIFFSEVNVDEVRKNNSSTSNAESLIGVSIIPLVNSSGALTNVSGAGNFPVVNCDQPLPRGYLKNLKNLNFFENGKELFRTTIAAFSSTLSNLNCVAQLIKCYKSAIECDVLIASLNDLNLVATDLIVPHFPALFHVLISFLSSHSSCCAQRIFECIFFLLIRIHSIDKRSSEIRTGIVHQFIEYNFAPVDDLPVHLFLVTQWVTFAILVKKKAASSPNAASALYSSSWMLFDLVAKSMILSVKTGDRIFSADFPRFLKKLFVELRQLMISGIFDGLAEANSFSGLNINMAMFLSDIVCVFDRGVVCDIVAQHLDEFNSAISNAAKRNANRECVAMSHLMLDFYKLFSDNENFVALNVPKNIDLSLPDTVASLGETVEEKHVLIAKIIQIATAELIDNSRLSSRCLSISIVSNLVTKIDRDARFNSADDRHLIAIMFFPLILRLIKYWKEMEAWRTGVDGSSKEKENLRATAPGAEATLVPGTAVSTNPSRIFERQELSFAVVWILRNLRQEWLIKWLSQHSQTEGFILLLDDLLQVFCRRLDSMAMNFASPFCATSSIIESLFDVAKHGMVAPLKLRTRLGARGVTATSEGTFDGSEETAKRARNVAHCVMMTVAQMGAHLLQIAKPKKTGKIGNNSAQLWPLLLVMLECELSAESAPFVFDLLYGLVNQLGSVGFSETKTEMSRAVAEVLRLCSFHSPVIRGEASAFLYFLVVMNLKFSSSIEVVKNAAILACSRLAETQKDFGGEALQNSLNTMCEYALQDLFVFCGGEDDEEKNRFYFVKQMQDMCRDLAKIVRQTKEIIDSRGSGDVERIGDQYFRIAEGYRNAPELRLEWLEKLAQFHAKNGDVTEAAISMTHGLALISDFLNNSSNSSNSNSPIVDIAVFKRITPGVSEFYSEEVASGGSAAFSVRHFKFAAKAIIKFFEQGEHFELASEVAQLLLPLYHREGAFRDLTNAHTQLESFYSKLGQNDSCRLLGKYYRVGFYGKLFGEELDGVEFVYKEKLLTHLFSLKERLMTHFASLFGAEKIDVLEHGGMVDTSILDPNKAYLQITALRPYWGEEEEPMRKSFISQNTNLSSFAFETPFSKSGKVGQTCAADQWMRRTILTTENVFPFLLKRVPVRSRRDIVIPPIEIAIELMQQRTEKLLMEVARNPPDSKTLQQVLQGSVLTTVNKGIVEYLEIFLSHAADFSKHHIRLLRVRFREFFSAAESALKVNKEISDRNQLEFHREMQNGYKELCKLADPLLKNEEDEETGNTDSTSNSPRPASASASPRGMGARSAATSPRGSPKTGRANSGSRRSSIRTTPLASTSSPASPRAEREATETVVDEMPMIATAKKSVHRLSVTDKPRRASSTVAVVSSADRKPLPRTSSSAHVGGKSPESNK